MTEGYLTYSDNFVMDLNIKSLYCTLETCSTSLIMLYTWASQVALVLKNPTANAGNIRDVGLVQGSGRSPEGGHGKPLQYSRLENPMDRGAWWAVVHRVTKSWTRLKRLSMHTCLKLT